MLRSRLAELESRTTNAANQLRRAMELRRELIECLRENHQSIRRIVDETSRRKQMLEAVAQRVSSR